MIFVYSIEELTCCQICTYENRCYNENTNESPGAEHIDGLVGNYNFVVLLQDEVYIFRTCSSTKMTFMNMNGRTRPIQDQLQRHNC